MRFTARAVLAVLLAAAGAVRAAHADALAEGSGFDASFAAAMSGASRLPPALVVDFDVDETVLADPAAPPKPKWLWVGVGAALAIGGSAVSAYSETPKYPFHVTNEGWFGQNTYVGGADKASHFVSYYIVTRFANEYNKAFHVPGDQAALIATGTAFLAGLMTEIGDGTNKFGFSWEDLTMDALGALSGLAIIHYRLDDLIGFRAGWVPGAPTSPVGGLGRDYSSEIYTADLKFSGLGKRACFNPGPARFFLFSVTYGTKGYPYSPPEVRQRQIGLEIGINFDQVLEVLKVPRDKWWGICLYTLFDVIRFPYTAIGWRYDLNGGKWYGPDTGNTFPNPGF
jgi:hypothetical protein